MSTPIKLAAESEERLDRAAAYERIKREVPLMAEAVDVIERELVEEEPGIEPPVKEEPPLIEEPIIGRK